ncbi:hypothetical protein SBC1_47240 (plasmid) [Caballeronia sp. SBC1]|uniref:DUF4148 domain-containing protein n=1 Tax=unclassified Caballeronia TaxID=2646786 RepID=UPI0013E1AE7A|nr:MULTISPECIES: DUF4148 domain-containing protein [unclassified Caballeronia]QIE26003.1 hypothetical protein SBC2_40730 [Caballeronia sp. SBC2]QIN64684.1 hypothetical protein SBC1_47240 [Caballeronia sp. SBC1]
MKSLVLKLLAASALTLPLASFAQTANEAVTRAQVRADLINAEQQGTVPPSKTHYPASQDAASNTTLRADQQGSDTNNAYGSSTYGSSQSSNVIPLVPRESLFSHH